MIASSDFGQKAQDYTSRNSYVLLEYCSGWNIAIYMQQMKELTGWLVIDGRKVTAI